MTCCLSESYSCSHWVFSSASLGFGAPGGAGCCLLRLDAVGVLRRVGYDHLAARAGRLLALRGGAEPVVEVLLLDDRVIDLRDGAGGNVVPASGDGHGQRGGGREQRDEASRSQGSAGG